MLLSAVCAGPCDEMYNILRKPLHCCLPGLLALTSCGNDYLCAGSHSHKAFVYVSYGTHNFSDPRCCRLYAVGTDLGLALAPVMSSHAQSVNMCTFGQPCLQLQC